MRTENKDGFVRTVGVTFIGKTPDANKPKNRSGSGDGLLKVIPYVN
jgi:hypothetical protein